MLTNDRGGRGKLESQVGQHSLKDFAEQELKIATLRKIIYLLEEQGIDF